MSETLNQEQLDIVTHSGSPLLIVAGPGSGKTMVIIERVIHLIKNGLKPSEVLCLTFSEKAAKEMEERLEKKIDITDMQISTFHSFAKTILEENILDSGVDLSGGLIKRSALLVWGLENIDMFNLQHLEVGNNAIQLIESIIDGISTFKDELISPQDLQAYLTTRLKSEVDEDIKDFLMKLSDLCNVYHKYQEFQRKRSVIDFDDMVVQVIDLFRKKPIVLSKYQRKFKYILVDEFQDTNYAQLELIKLLSMNGNITIVGDDDQSIYRFQGSYLTNFRDFKEYFPNHRVGSLNQNYRSTKNIVNVATRLLLGVKNREPKNLFSENKEGQKVVVSACSNELAEVEFVVSKIRDLLGQKIRRRDGTESFLTYKDFAILSRRKIDGKKFANSLRTYGIPTEYVGESNIFTAPIARDLISYLKIANSPTKSGIEITRLLKRQGITDLNIAKINHAAKIKARKDATDIDFVFESIKNCNEIGLTQTVEVQELANQLQDIIAMEGRHTISDFVHELMMSSSDLFRRTLVDDSAHSQRNQLLLKEIYKISMEYESLNPQGTLNDFINYITLLGKFEVDLPEGMYEEDCVRVTTIHQSKGKEFPVVFVVDVAMYKLPLKYQAKTFYVPNDLAKGLKRDEDEKQLHLEEERRLLYVAMTRARELLFITYARKYGNNIRETKPSLFLEEIDFSENPYISFMQYNIHDNDLKIEIQDKVGRLKHELKNNAVTCINQMQLRSAIIRIIDLAKIDYFERKGDVTNFDPSKVLDISYIDNHVDAELLKTKLPLVNKDKLKLSASSIQTYMDCPLKFKFSHILEVPQAPTAYFGVGVIMHGVIKQLTDLQKDGTNITNDLGQLVLEKTWNSSSFFSETQENQAKRAANKMVKAFVEWLSYNPNVPVSAEQEFRIQISGVPFIGYIDRIEQTTSGEIQVIDFKTGSVYKNSRSIREDPQMNLYAMGIEKLYNKLPSRTSLYYLEHEKMVSYDVDESQLNRVKSVIEQKTNLILNEEFEATPSYGVCRTCPYWAICDSKQTEE